MAPYLRIVADIRESIRSGELRDGDLLPSLSELMAEYGVSQATASKAVRRAVADGLATSQPGVGVFARVWRPIVRVVPDRFAAPNFNERDTRGRSLVVAGRAERAAPPPELVELIGHGLAVVRRRLYAVDGRPVQWAESWIPGDIAPDILLRDDTGPGGLWARLAEVGHGPVGETVEQWRVRPATDDERELLELPPGSRVLDGQRVARDAGRRAVDVARMTLPEAAYVLEFRFDL